MRWTLSLQSNFWILFLLESGTKIISYERCGYKGQRLKAKNWANSDISLSPISGMCSTGMERLVLCLLMSNVKHPLFSFIQMMDGWKNWWRCKKRSSETLQEPDFDPSHSHLSISPSQRGETQWHQHHSGRGIHSFLYHL